MNPQDSCSDSDTSSDTPDTDPYHILQCIINGHKLNSHVDNVNCVIDGYTLVEHAIRNKRHGIAYDMVTQLTRLDDTLYQEPLFVQAIKKEINCRVLQHLLTMGSDANTEIDGKTALSYTLDRCLEYRRMANDKFSHKNDRRYYIKLAHYATNCVRVLRNAGAIITANNYKHEALLQAIELETHHIGTDQILGKRDYNQSIDTIKIDQYPCRQM